MSVSDNRRFDGSNPDFFEGYYNEVPTDEELPDQDVEIATPYVADIVFNQEVATERELKVRLEKR